MLRSPNSTSRPNHHYFRRAILFGAAVEGGMAGRVFRHIITEGLGTQRKEEGGRARHTAAPSLALWPMSETQIDSNLKGN